MGVRDGFGGVGARRSMGVCVFKAEDGIRDAQESRGLGEVYKGQTHTHPHFPFFCLNTHTHTLDSQRTATTIAGSTVPHSGQESPLSNFDRQGKVR